MTELENTNNNIQNGITGILSMTNQEIDLKDDVLPFIKPMLSKISQLSTYTKDFENLYDLTQIVNNYLPKTIQSYCGLPVEYRNTKIIKDNKTARDLLISDLKLLKQQVNELEKKILADKESNIRINSNILKEKFSPQLQLATEVEKDHSDAFINQFDINKYISQQSYDIFNKKVIETKPKVVVNKLHNANNYIKKNISLLLNNLKQCFIKIKQEYSLIPVLAIGGLCSFPAILIITMILLIRYDNFNRDIKNEVSHMYSILRTTQLTNMQLVPLKDQLENQLLDGSNYRKYYFHYELLNNTIIVNLNHMSKDNCISAINYNKENFHDINFEVNNLSSDKTSSTLQLCYLKDENNLKFYFNKDNIFNKSK